jgi:hypothetical protein
MLSVTAIADPFSERLSLKVAPVDSVRAAVSELRLERR